MDAVGAWQWIPLNPSAPAGAPTAREGACLAWSGQTSSDNGHRLGEQTLILFGGITSGGVYSNEVNIYNIVNNSWEFKSTTLSPSPSGRAYMQCARFSSSGGGLWEYNGIVMSGGYAGGGVSINDIWVFCDHPGSGESDTLGCGAFTRQWVQFSIGLCGNTLKRHGAAASELNTRPLPETNHAYDDEFILWGGSRDGTLVRDAAWVRWISNTQGGKTFECIGFVDSGGTMPSPRIYPGVGYMKTSGGNWYMVIFGGWTGSIDSNEIWALTFQIGYRIVWYLRYSVSGSSPAPRNGAIFPCNYNDFPELIPCQQPITYVMFGGQKSDGPPPPTKYDDTWTAYLT